MSSLQKTPTILQFDMKCTKKTTMKTTKRESGKLPASPPPPPPIPLLLLFNMNEATNVAKTFLSLIDKHFHKYKRFSKIFNRNTIKISYSCLPNVKQTISYNNNRSLQLHRMKKSSQDSKLCNCRQKNSSDHVWKLKKQKHRLQHETGGRQKGEVINSS